MVIACTFGKVLFMVSYSDGYSVNAGMASYGSELALKVIECSHIRSTKVSADLLTNFIPYPQLSPGRSQLRNGNSLHGTVKQKTDMVAN